MGRPPYNADMALPPDICIRGAGIVGRTLALLLARERLNVALVESPAPEARADVRAYSLNGASMALLQSLAGEGGLALKPASQPVSTSSDALETA